MRTSTTIALSILFQFIGILVTAIILEKGDINSIGLIVVIFILPIVVVGFLNGLLLDFANKRKEIYNKRIWSFIPIIILAVIAISNIRFLDGDMSYIGLIGLIAIGLTNTIWNLKLQRGVIQSTVHNNGSSPIDGNVRKKIINLINKPILSRQLRVPYSANWR